MLCEHAQHDEKKRSLTLFWGAVRSARTASPALAVLIDVSFSSHLGDDQSAAHNRCSDGVFSCRGLVWDPRSPPISFKLLQPCRARGPARQYVRM